MNKRYSMRASKSSLFLCLMSAVVRLYPQEPAKIDRDRVAQKLVFSEPIFFLGFKDVVVEKLRDCDLMRREILMELLLDIIFDTSEALYNDLYRHAVFSDSSGRKVVKGSLVAGLIVMPKRPLFK